jgi:hypothetical protein
MGDGNTVSSRAWIPGRPTKSPWPRRAKPAGLDHSRVRAMIEGFKNVSYTKQKFENTSKFLKMNRI